MIVPVLLASLWVWISPADATVPEKYGFGARSLGLAGGGVALVDDGTASYVNPAGLSRIRRPAAMVGLTGAMENFDPISSVYWDTNQDGVIDDLDIPLDIGSNVDNAVGIHAIVGRHIGGRFGLGLSAYVPTGRLLQFSTFEPSLPHYFMYQGRMQRYVLTAGIGGEIVRGVNIGVSVDFVPRATMDMFLTITASTSAANAESGQPDSVVTDIQMDVHELSLNLVPDFAPMIGVQLEVGRWIPAVQGLVLGATLRGPVGLPIDVNLDMQTNFSIEDIGDLEPYIGAAVLTTKLQLYDHYVPLSVGLGIAYRTDETLSAYLDARWTDWRGMVLNVARIQTDDSKLTSPFIDLNDAFSDGNNYSVTLRPVWSMRMGTELRLPQWELQSRFKYLRAVVRGGFGLEPSPLISQGESSALLDGDRTLFALGFGLETWDPLNWVNGPINLDVSLQYHVLARSLILRDADVPKPGDPVEGNGHRAGGNILVLGAQWGFAY